MPFINDNTLDNGLAALKAAATGIYLCSSEPATFTAATSTVALGNKVVAAGSVFPAAIAAGTPSGRKITTMAVTDGAITASGTATHDAIVSSASSRLETTQALGASQAVVNGNTFTKTAQDIRLPAMGG